MRNCNKSIWTSPNNQIFYFNLLGQVSQTLLYRVFDQRLLSYLKHRATQRMGTSHIVEQSQDISIVNMSCSLVTTALYSLSKWSGNSYIIIVVTCTVYSTMKLQGSKLKLLSFYFCVLFSSFQLIKSFQPGVACVQMSPISLLHTRKSLPHEARRHARKSLPHEARKQETCTQASLELQTRKLCFSYMYIYTMNHEL